jgi:hypothetical protein
MANTTTATCLPLFPSLEMAWRPSSKWCARTRSSLPARRTVAAGRVGHRWGTPEAKAALAILADGNKGRSIRLKRELVRPAKLMR